VRDGALCIEWEQETRPAAFDLEWLAGQAAGADCARPEVAPKRWLHGAQIDVVRDFAWAALAAAQADPDVRRVWLSQLLSDGIAFLRQVPPTDAGILAAVSWIGRVAETNYGQVFDVRSVPQPENLAYSDLGLGLHTDNPYRDPVPGFQVLHALQVSPEGGDSLFADGFALADHLRATDPAAFALLTRTPVPFLYRSPDAELYAERPLIQLSAGGEVTAVHYNSRSIAPLRIGARDAAAFYGAYRQFARLLRYPRHQVNYRLTTGDLVVFDNHRVLHGRTRFSSAQFPRHLRGCYLTRDSVRSQAALARRGCDRWAFP
jgi:gamma-butyrobetaine dioxygenase